MAAPRDDSVAVFHDSWHRVAHAKVSLRPNLEVRRQFYQGVQWHVVHDPFSNQFWRLRPAAYDLICRLGQGRTVEEAWLESLRRDPEDAPGQGEVIELLGQLYQSNILRYDGARDGETLFERKRKRDNKKLRSNLSNILFLRIPLFDPDDLLKRMLPLARIVFSPAGIALWCAAVFLAGREAVASFDILKDRALGVLSPSNLVLLYVSGFLVKIVHEFGHATAVRRQGGEVHAMGVMFMMLAPMPYTDASASWALRERWRRILVSCSGVIFELFVASLALLLWSRLGEGDLRSLCYNVFFVASVTTLLFNVNPLMRFDGYYVLSDLLDIPNLQQKASSQIQYLFERFALDLREAEPATSSVGEGWFLSLYGVASSLYRITVFGGILVAVSKQYLILALLMGAMTLWSMAIQPLWKFCSYLATSPRLRIVRQRAMLVCAGTLGAVALVSTAIPFPDSFTAPGVLQARLREVVVNPVGGRVVRIACAPGTRVHRGDTLILLENQDLDRSIEQTRGALEEARSRFQQAVALHPEDAQPASRKVEVLEQDLSKLLRDREDLAVRAGVDGIWSTLRDGELEGRWIRRGDSLGEVADTTRWRFLAAVPQEDVERLFASDRRTGSVRLSGSFGSEIAVDSARAIPFERSRLPSAALGWLGGGELEIDASRGDPSRTAEPFHLLEADLGRPSVPTALLHGRSGRIRLVAGHRPLVSLAWRRLRQLLQKHYRL